MKIYNRNILYITLLLLLNIGTHFSWFFGTGYITHGDTGVFAHETINGFADNTFFLWDNTS